MAGWEAAVAEEEAELASRRSHLEVGSLQISAPQHAAKRQTRYTKAKPVIMVQPPGSAFTVSGAHLHAAKRQGRCKLWQLRPHPLLCCEPSGPGCGVLGTRLSSKPPLLSLDSMIGVRPASEQSLSRSACQGGACAEQLRRVEHLSHRAPRVARLVAPCMCRLSHRLELLPGR